MIRNKVVAPNAEIVIDLNGPHGNAFFLLGYANKLANQLGLDVPPILEAMKAGDYENLIQVFDNHFGDFVVLER
jgi:hypothetical protein